ncbi:MAG: hypothetical protein ABL909_07565 [Sphingopyxis sp.]
MTKGRKIVGIWPTEDIEITVKDIPVTEQPLEETTQSPREHAAPSAPEITVEPETEAGAESDPELGNDTLWLTLDDPAPERPHRGWITPTLLTIAGLLWAGFVCWSQSAGFAELVPMTQWPSIAAMISTPIALILIAVLLFERATGRSVNRHLSAMAQMRTEHQQLAERLSTIDQHWQTAQNTLNQRALTLADTALQAGQQLSTVSDALDLRMEKAVSLSAAINEKNEATQRAMDALLIALPKIDEVSQRAAEAMRESGQTAYQYGGQLEAQIAAVRHESSEAQSSLTALSAQLAESMACMTSETSALGANAMDITDKLNNKLDAQREAALSLVADLTAAMEQNCTTSEERLAIARANSASATQEHIAAMDTALIGNAEKAASLVAALANSSHDVDAFDARFDTLVADIAARAAAIESIAGQHIGATQASVLSLSQSLDALGDNSAGATEHSEQLARRAAEVVTMLQAAQREITLALPEAIERLSSMVKQSQESVEALPDLIGVSATDSAVLLTRLRSSEQSIEAQSVGLEVIEARMAGVIGAQTNSISNLQTTLESLAVRMREIANTDADALKESLSHVDAHARNIVESSAGRFESALADALDKATGDSVNERLATIANASGNAVKAASAASERLMRQLITIADSSAALESRANEVDKSIEEGQGNILSRQVALLTEALQSSAVDLARVLDSDVADQAWEAYLKGDRSIFARRTLRLLTAAEAKALLRRYEEEEDFRTLVNRYIHDFEAMLRGIMNTRDGQQLSVTLLSSDIGKIYVALAQAIERLRG